MADNWTEYLGQTVELLRVVTTVLRKVCRGVTDLANQPSFSFTLPLTPPTGIKKKVRLAHKISLLHTHQCSTLSPDLSVLLEYSLLTLYEGSLLCQISFCWCCEWLLQFWLPQLHIWQLLGYVRLSGDCFLPSIENAVGRPPPYLRTV